MARRQFLAELQVIGFSEAKALSLASEVLPKSCRANQPGEKARHAFEGGGVPPPQHTPGCSPYGRAAARLIQGRAI